MKLKLLGMLLFLGTFFTTFGVRLYACCTVSQPYATYFSCNEVITVACQPTQFMRCRVVGCDRRYKITINGDCVTGAVTFNSRAGAVSYCDSSGFPDGLCIAQCKNSITVVTENPLVTKKEQCLGIGSCSPAPTSVCAFPGP